MVEGIFYAGDRVLGISVLSLSRAEVVVDVSFA